MHAKRALSRITCRSLFIYIFNTFLFMAIFTPLISQASGQAYTAPIEATEKSTRPFGRLYKLEFALTVAHASIRILFHFLNVLTMKLWTAVLPSNYTHRRKITDHATTF